MCDFKEVSFVCIPRWKGLLGLFFLGIVGLEFLDVATAGNPRNDSSQAVAPDSTESKGESDLIVRKIVSVEKLFDSFHQVIDVGTLPCGKSVTIEVSLNNPNAMVFDFSQIELGCKCTSAEISESRLEPGGKTTLTLKLQTPDASKSVVRSHGITLVTKGNKKNSITLALRYRLSGLMGFKDGAHVFNVDPEKNRQSILLPFVLTEPIELQDVQLGISPPTLGAQASMVTEKGLPFVKVEFDPVFVVEEGLSLTVTATYAAKNLEDSVPLLLCRRRLVEVTPRTLRFKQTEEQLVSTCLLRLRDSADPAIDPEKESLSLQAMLGDVKLSVTPKRIGAGIYRVKLSADAEQVASVIEKHPELKAVQWQVTTATKNHLVESSFRVDTAVDTSLFPNQ